MADDRDEETPHVRLERILVALGLSGRDELECARGEPLGAARALWLALPATLSERESGFLSAADRLARDPASVVRRLAFAQLAFASGALAENPDHPAGRRELGLEAAKGFSAAVTDASARRAPPRRSPEGSLGDSRRRTRLLVDPALVGGRVSPGSPAGRETRRAVARNGSCFETRNRRFRAVSVRFAYVLVLALLAVAVSGCGASNRPYVLGGNTSRVETEPPQGQASPAPPR